MSGQTHASTTMSIHAHIKELRTRLFIVALIFIVASTIAYYFRDPIIDLLLSPLNGEKLSYLTPGGGFSFILKVVMWGGIALALPFLIFAIYGFISPTLPKTAQKKSSMILILSFILLCCGATFGYIYAIPGAIRFLLGFADTYVTANLTADSYLDFILMYTIGLGVLFQIPLLMIIINWIKPLKPMKLLSFERYVIVAAFVLAAFVTPTPDPLNQTIIATPIVAMYQVGFIAVAFSRGNERRTLRAARKKETKLNKKLAANQRPVAMPKIGRQAVRGHYIQSLVAKRVLTSQAKPAAKSPKLAHQYNTKMSKPVVSIDFRKAATKLPQPKPRPTQTLHVQERSQLLSTQQRPSQVISRINSGPIRSLDGVSNYPIQKST